MSSPSDTPESGRPAPGVIRDRAGGSRGSSPGTSGFLPTDLAEAGSKRLGATALVWATLWGLGVFINHVVAPIISPGKPLDDAWPWPGTPTAAVVIAVSIALFVYTRRGGCNCRRALHMGLAYEVLLAFAIGLVNQWTPNTVGLSWICVLIVIHPMLVPNRRRWVLLASLIAASMDPVGILITRARGVPVPGFAELVWAWLPNYVCAFLAVVPSHVLARLGREVNRARELGSYRLGELLGRGGMGEVYEAHHVMMHRPAAIKLIRPEALGGEGLRAQVVLRRFRREAEAVANLHSPHTIILYDFGVTGNEDFYYVMELLRGLDLESLVRRFGPVEPARTVHLLTQACHSLAEAHARGLVHRDVKPSNLFTCWVGLEPDFVKVLDFGLVKVQGESAGDETQLTAPDIAAGTPAYMAPEASQSDTVDGRADIYALGCVGYWLLTGRVVFEGKTPTRMILAHIQDRPEPPSALSEFKIDPGLDAVILSCLEKSPADRPQTALELARALSACRTGTPWTRETAEAWWRRHVPELIP